MGTALLLGTPPSPFRAPPSWAISLWVLFDSTGYDIPERGADEHELHGRGRRER